MISQVKSPAAKPFCPATGTSRVPLSSCILALLVGLWCVPVCAADPSESTPNIILIFADDLGWSDLACYGNTLHETPHLDQLARQGMRFTNGYSAAPICSASRAGLLTGKTPARVHFEFVTKETAGSQIPQPGQTLRSPPFTLDLPLEEVTIAEALSQLDYQTYFFGKWHLNAHHNGYLGWSPTHGPPNQGFEFATQDFGGHPYSYKKSPPKPIEKVGEYPADSLVDAMCEAIQKEHQQPFFMMASHFYVHTPVKTPCKWLIEKYSEKLEESSPHRMARIRYAAFVETLDHYVGQLLQALDASGLADETVVIFTSDNGGHPEFASNAPLRGSKWNLYEGGIRVPLIVLWPGTVEPGTTCDQPVAGYDITPTCVEIASADTTTSSNSAKSVLPESIDGVSFLPMLQDPQTDLTRDLNWHFPYYHPERGYTDSLTEIGVNDFAVSQTRPQSAIRSGKYKLLYFDENDRSELYDLSTDISEQNDLSASQPMRTMMLRNRLMEYLYEQPDGAQARRATPLDRKTSEKN
ncbi:Arylsulfatase [Thalassoglobus neptunius]|uniref:Arylsulfatase n=1 Tax=Thalassoglobus neptunius TaxID=1938619 RepID=A0A5C5X193_9PLAN|nr:sulfatase [Thalassoglobus neptunius]TWT56767.1 Arylsulfatase [Thalassoglobus neptunius]